eukprot:g60287.t1
MEVSEDEEEEQEEQEQEQKEDEKEQKVEEENDDDEEGGDDEGPPVYNPSPYTPLQTVDPSSDRPRHKARSTMDQKFDIDPTLHFLYFFPTEMLPNHDLTSFLLARSASGTTCEPRGFYLSGGLAVVTLLRAKLCLGLYSSSS